MSEFDEIHDDTASDKPPQPVGMAVPQRCLNSIEISLVEGFEHELDALCPYPILESLDDDDASDLLVLANPEMFAHYFDGRNPTIREVYDLCRELTELVAEKWRAQISIARSLGGIRRDGGPFVREYVARCKAEGVEPWNGITPLSD